MLLWQINAYSRCTQDLHMIQYVQLWKKLMLICLLQQKVQRKNSLLNHMHKQKKRGRSPKVLLLNGAATKQRGCTFAGYLRFRAFSLFLFLQCEGFHQHRVLTHPRLVRALPEPTSRVQSHYYYHCTSHLE
jgi:hypothetical protein